MPVLSARHLTKTFTSGGRSLTVLDDVSFDIEPGATCVSSPSVCSADVLRVPADGDLPAVVANAAGGALILIDTAGFRQGDPLLKEQEALLDSCPGLERILVLACNSQLQTLKASAHAHSGGKLRGCVLTKLDEAGSLGEALGVVIQQKLPVLYCADGQAIPNDLSVASAAALVAKAVGVMKAQKENVAAGSAV